RPPGRQIVVDGADGHEVGADADEGGMAETHLSGPAAQNIPRGRPASEEQHRDADGERAGQQYRIEQARAEQNRQADEMAYHTRFTVRPKRPSGLNSRMIRNTSSP